MRDGFLIYPMIKLPDGVLVLAPEPATTVVAAAAISLAAISLS